MYHYPSVLGVFICLLCITVNSLTDRGTIKVSGAPSTWSPHIAGGNCGVSISGGTALTLSQNCAPRVYMMSDSTHFAKFPNMLGKSVKFTVNLASSTCGCNAAVYFINPPASVTGGDSYCDAQCPSGTNMLGCCEEIDIFEANTHAFQATAHCSGNNDPCKWGCGVNYKSGNGYGPGGSKINTNADFDCEMDFIPNGSTLKSIKITLRQGSNSISTTLTDSSCSLKSGYISGLTSAIAGGRLVMAISYWGGDMNWLDGCSAGGSCPGSSTVTFKNFAIGTAPSSLIDDGDATESSFIGSPGFYAVIGISVLIVLLAVVATVVIVKRRNLPESV